MHAYMYVSHAQIELSEWESYSRTDRKTDRQTEYSQGAAAGAGAAAAGAEGAAAVCVLGCEYMCVHVLCVCNGAAEGAFECVRVC